MATVIRLKRGGRRHAPFYRVVVMDSRTRALGREVDLIGFYHPCARPQPLAEIDTDKALAWLAKGAQPSDTVRTVLSKKGIMAAFASGVRPAGAVTAAAEPSPEPVPAEVSVEPAPDTAATE